MAEPLIILLLFFTAIIVLLVLFIPGKGIIPRWRKIKSQGERIFVEDALKHFYNYEYNSLDSSLESLRDNLSLKEGKGSRLVLRLEEMGLIQSQNGKIKLTANGRSYALKVIRIHRLWELHLADNTSVAETEWHSIAEEREHQTDEDTIKQLAAKLGNPLRDPHGDPIPSEDGEMPSYNGILLTDLQEGMFATIVHIEDEPKETYAQLSAEGLHAGMQIRMLYNNEERIRFEANGEECLLAPVIASNVTVVPISNKEEVQEFFETLSSIDQGEEAVVAGISRALRGQQRRRMLDFGIVPGTKIRAQLRSLGGDPTAYEIRGTTVALRKNQTDFVYVKRNQSMKEV
ncbi:MAG: FeoA domain-containing protein [Candidatus Kapaibacterium sp.]